MACSGPRQHTDMSLIKIFFAMIVIALLGIFGPSIERAFEDIAADIEANSTQAALEDMTAEPETDSPQTSPESEEDDPFENMSESLQFFLFCIICLCGWLSWKGLKALFSFLSKFTAKSPKDTLRSFRGRDIDKSQDDSPL